MTIDQRLDRIEKILRELVHQKETVAWVKMSTVLKETGMSREWVRQQREADKTLAIPTGKRFKYNLNKLKSLAA